MVRPTHLVVALNLLLAATILLTHAAAPEETGGATDVAQALDITDAAISTGERYVRALGTAEPSAPVRYYPGALPAYLAEAAIAPPPSESP